MLFEVLHLEILARMDNLSSFLPFLLILSCTAFNKNGKILFLKNLAIVWVVSERFWWERWLLEYRCSVSCREQPSVLENVYHLHYNFFKGKGQNILHVSFSFISLFISMLCYKILQVFSEHSFFVLSVVVPSWQTVNLSNRTGEDRRWQTLCRKRGNNLVWKEFLSTFTFL